MERAHAVGIGVAVVLVGGFFVATSPTMLDSRPQSGGRPSVGGPPNTVWATTRAADGNVSITRNGAPFTVKGVCYGGAETNSDASAGNGGTMGDFFMDARSGPGYVLESWHALWGSAGSGRDADRGDLRTINVEIGGNAIRTYFVQSRLYAPETNQPGPPAASALLTHAAFLDEALKQNLAVLAYIPLPKEFFRRSSGFASLTAAQVGWWEFVLNETAAELGRHPAVMGIGIANEADDQTSSFPGSPAGSGAADANTDHFYAQLIRFARYAKAHAPSKLVGWTTFDIPEIPGFGALNHPTTASPPTVCPAPAEPCLDPSTSYLEQALNAVDFIGVNSYQSMTLAPVFDASPEPQSPVAYRKGYGDPLMRGYVKPVILTEIGYPGLGREDPTDCASPVVDAPAPWAKSAAAMRLVIPQCYGTYKGLCAGVMYFEFADELWKTGPQDSCTPASAPPPAKAGAPWWLDPGKPTGKPNGFADEDGFGLYGRSRTPPRAPEDSNWVNGGYRQGPALPVDTLHRRDDMVEALKGIFESV